MGNIYKEYNMKGKLDKGAIIIKLNMGKSPDEIVDSEDDNLDSIVENICNSLGEVENPEEVMTKVVDKLKERGSKDKLISKKDRLMELMKG